MIEPQFWKGRRVLITGNTGFKGSWLSLWLQELGAEVAGLSLGPPTQPNLYELADVGAGMSDNTCDVRSEADVAKVVKDCRPEVLFHLAAQPLVRLSYAEPLKTVAVNVMGTANVLNACRDIDGLRAVVVITTDKCYENPDSGKRFVESDPVGGFDPYSASKGAAELVTACFRRSFFAPQPEPSAAGVATARAGNVLGGGDWGVDRLFTDIVAAFDSGEELVLRNPDAVRPWQHVLDPLHGYLRLAEELWRDPGGYGEGWNFGPAPASERPVRELVDLAAAQWGGGAGWKLDDRFAPHEAPYLALDCSKSTKRLNWRAVLGLEEVVKLTVDWHLALKAGEDVRTCTIGQITQFMDLLQGQSSPKETLS